MKDRHFLLWIYTRLQFVHGENPSVDYMRRLATMIEAMPDDQHVVVAAPAFVREARYIVIKRKDAEQFLEPAALADLKFYCDAIAFSRTCIGKQPLQCVVVESDWPEYEPTWKAIEQRVAREKSEGARHAT